MGGVDKADMMLSFYKSKHRSRKWYHRIFFHLVNLSIVNSWILYKSIGGETSLVDFTVDIIRCLLRGVEDIGAEPKEDSIIMSKLKSLKFVDVPLALKYDGKQHWPVQICSEPQRCKMPECKKRTRFMCSKCSIYLCVIGSHCFLNFHNVTVN